MKKYKFRRFVRTVPMKFYILLAVIVIFSFFSNDFELVDIQKTAIILAAGVDRSENGYVLTAQIAVPKGSERTTGGTSSVEIDGEGETVSDCVAEIYSKTGWVPKFIFCNLIVLGEDTVKERTFGALDFFLRNEYMSDSCLVAVSAGKASELLSSISAIDNTSSLAINQLFSASAEKSGKITKNTLKEFAIGYYSVSKSGYLPFVRMQTQSGSDDQAQSGGQGGGSAQGQSGGGSDQKIYTAEETALFYDGAMVGLLTPEQTYAFNLLNESVVSSEITVQEGGKNHSLAVLRNSGDVSLSLKNNPALKISVTLTVRTSSCCSQAPIGSMAYAEVSPEVEQKAREAIGGYLKGLWENSKSSGCDLFFLTQKLYRSSLGKYAEWKDTLLQALEPEFEVSVKGTK